MSDQPYYPQHTTLDSSLPKSGLHDPDCKWLCTWVAQPGQGVCPRKDHAECAYCRGKG